MQTHPPASPAHVPSLDGLRGLAILLVIPHNLRLLVEPHDALSHWLTFWFDRGWVGVQLFFVLSGFLITRILLRSRQSEGYFKAFFMRRTLRIWPLYYGSLALVLWVLPALGVAMRRDPQLDIYLLSFLSNYVHPFHPGAIVMPHFWSLAVEEQFYLVWPIVVWFCAARQLAWVSLALIALTPLVRFALLHAGMSTDVIYEWTPCRMDALAFGAMAAAMLEQQAVLNAMKRHPRWWTWGPWGLLILGAMATHAYEFISEMQHVLGYTALAMACAALLMRSVLADEHGVGKPMNWARWAWLARVGRYSFAMYVWHVPLNMFVWAPLAERWGWTQHPGFGLQLAYALSGLLVSYVLGVLSYELLEKHFLALKARFTVGAKPLALASP